LTELQPAPVTGKRLVRSGEHGSAGRPVLINQRSKPLRAVGIKGVKRLVE
jgi:hypothetical protein